MKSGLSILILPLLSLISSTTLADDVRYYDFEIIIFESLDKEGKTSETWKNNASVEFPKAATPTTKVSATGTPRTEPPTAIVTLGKPYPGPMPKEYNPKYTFRLLPKKSYRLSEDAKLLEESGNYRILMHTAWRQPGMSAKTALPIHLHKEYIVTQKTPEEIPVATDPDMPAINLPAPSVTTIRSRAILDGYLKIILSRYLHANFDLIYKTGLPLNPAPTVTIGSQEDNEEAGDSNIPAIASYHLQQTRKMRSKEVHYIDHPVLGIVMLAWPYKGKDVKSN